MTDTPPASETATALLAVARALSDVATAINRLGSIEFSAITLKQSLDDAAGALADVAQAMDGRT